MKVKLKASFYLFYDLTDDFVQNNSNTIINYIYFVCVCVCLCASEMNDSNEGTKGRN